MRSLLYLTALLLALPQMLLALAFGLLLHLTADRTLGSVLARSFDLFVAIFSWKGAVVILTLAALIALAFITPARWWGTAILVALNVGSAALVIWTVRDQFSFENVWIFIPGIIALAIAIRLLMLEWPWRIAVAAPDSV